MAKHSPKTQKALFIRNFIFGVEDSLVSTSGMIAGIAAAGIPKAEIFTAGIVLIFVEAFSMGVGSFLSESFTEDYTKQSKSSRKSNIAGIVMLFSYFFSGFIPLAPYIFYEVIIAFPLSIFVSLVSLFLLGSLSAKHYKLNVIKHGLKMLIIGGFAISIGVIIGKITD